MTSCPRFHGRFLGLHVPVALLSQNQLLSIPLTCPDPALKGKGGKRVYISAWTLLGTVSTSVSQEQIPFTEATWTRKGGRKGKGH